MKKSDFAMIILIASVSILTAYFVTRGIIGDIKSESATVQTIDPITSEVETPDKSVFNENAINPTVEIIIGGDTNQPAGE